MVTDKTRREAFITQNLGLVHACAGRFRGRGMEYDDLYSAGCVGLIKAYDNFDESRGVCFSTYAVPVILGEIKKLFRDGGTVKVSRSLKELGMRVQAAREHTMKLCGAEPTLQQLAEQLDEPIENVALAIQAAQPAMSLTPDAEYLYAELVKRNIPAVIMEPLLGGRLSRLNDHLMARLKQRRPQESVASWAFRFAGTFPDVLTVLSGMTYMEHLQDNLRTFSPLVPCTEEEFTLLEDTAQRMLQYPTVPCNDCKYCMPCPYGLDIPAILLHYNRCINEGNVPQNSQDENYREARRAFLIGYDRSVPRLRQANRCTGCGQCNPHCPQGIDIPAKLQEIDRFVEALKQETL